MVEIEKKDDGKCLIICPFMPPDEDELIKDTFFFETPDGHADQLRDGWTDPHGNI